jgi:mono/diheme cytochrome c family protein
MNLLSETKFKYFLPSILSLFLYLSFVSAAVAQAEEGEKLFKSYCASCHSPGTNQLVGPGLAGVQDKYEREWLYKWIKNSQELISAGDEQAIAIYEQYNKVLMPAQPVTNEDIDAILNYIKVYSEAAPAANNVAAEAEAIEGEETDAGDGNMLLIFVIIVVLLIVIAVLRSVQHSLQLAEATRKGELAPEHSSLWQGLLNWGGRNKRIVVILGLIVIVVIAKQGWDAALGIGVYEGYEPEQPIKFSHKLHAGENGIDCNYCHNTAAYSKSAGIPPANLCMNCHTYIQEGPEHGKEEIAKIYEALDFDPVTKTYGNNQKPIKWVKVHNLPDHAYFNHSQHVTIGKIACQKCHGPVETYTVGKQHAPLTMGWCINCHRETKVQMDDNGYYDEIHARLPEELKKEYLEDGTITVEELGGTECAKCHY